MKGQILICSWGYSMILHDFVEVLKETPKTLLVRMLEKQTVGGDGYGRPEVKPAEPLRPYVYYGKETIIRLYKDGDNWFTKKNGYYQSYKLWDGKAKTEDHND